MLGKKNSYFNRKVDLCLNKDFTLSQSQMQDIFSIIKLAKYLDSSLKVELLRRLKDNLFTPPNLE
jgi:hypothetical protein